MHSGHKFVSVLMMVLLMLLASCTSVPQVKQNPNQANPLSAQIRSLLETNAQIVELSAILNRENKKIDWSRAAQTTDKEGTTIVQLPILFNETTLELIAVSVNANQVTAVILSRLTREDQSVRFEIANMDSGAAVSGTVSSENGQAKVQRSRIGKSSGRSSVAEILTVVEPTGVSIQRDCGAEQANYTAAVFALSSALVAVNGACWGFFWTPACWGAIAAYVAASIWVGVAAGQLNNCLSGR